MSLLQKIVPVRISLLLCCLCTTTTLHAQILMTDQSLQAPAPVSGEPYHFDASVPTLTAPTGQEFTPSFDRLDFIDVRLEPQSATNTGTFQISIHENTITGPTLVLSAPASVGTNLFPNLNSHFTFEHTVPLTPGALYVFEITQTDGDSGWAIDCQNSTSINGQTNSNALSYPGGRFISAGTIHDAEDMMFREGLFARVDAQLTSTNTFLLSWSAAITNATLQKSDFISATNWSDLNAAVSTDGTNNTVILPPTGASAFYRLRSE